MVLCYEGKLSLICYAGTTSIILVLSFPQLLFDFVPKIWGSIFWGPILYYSLINMIIKFKLNTKQYQIAVRAVFLGFVFSVGCLICIHGSKGLKSFGIYSCVMSLFHYSEYLVIAWANPLSLNIDSFILNHSVHYLVAAVSSWIEFFIEFYFFPDIKQYEFVWIIGLLFCLGGEFLRKLAMITASSNFNHVVQYVHTDGHELVTHGIYSYMRHPSYVGWFWWSIGTQIILLNPICIILYTIVSWKFFNDRIYLEEITLLNFFGEDYYRYQKDVGTGLPFIYGYKVEL